MGHYYNYVNVISLTEREFSDKSTKEVDLKNLENLLNPILMK
jgi:hypothetical protein